MAENKIKIPLHVRWMIRRDMEDVLRIEEKAFEFPWCDEDFLRCLRLRNNIGVTTEYTGERNYNGLKIKPGQTIGYMILEILKSRYHVLNFAVDPNYHRRGIGSQMVKDLVKRSLTKEKKRISLEVRESNLGAQLFFRENGFRAENILHDHYLDSPGEDAYLMVYRVGSQIVTPVRSVSAI